MGIGHYQPIIYISKESKKRFNLLKLKTSVTEGREITQEEFMDILMNSLERGGKRSR